ncbi:MAG TPA: hypothetical protein DIT64_11555 [Verrucomicrobiales bacterium]|nr:hypothetical protein [Verrucomicrobiales bacterium]HCN77974.1 hypothetical protein [Verrucomicrobiales bacterium]HRJ09575.1 hypothetical protein [Prosthecobacter sp.]HRK13821.1 hypothetical protein [Prosthecobacter sp.]
MSTPSVQEISDKPNLGPVTLGGHLYPADPASPAFTELLMDCFNRGRNAAAARQAQTEALLHSKQAPPLPEKARKLKAKTVKAHA